MPRTTIAHAQFVHKRAYPFALVSKLAWRLVRSKVLFAYCASSKCRNDKGSVVHYSHRNDLVIESLQFLANPHLVFCLGVRNNELVWKRLTCNFLCTQSPLWFINFCCKQHDITLITI